MKRTSSTNDRVEMEMFNKRFCILFSKMWKIGVIYKVDRIREKANP